MSPLEDDTRYFEVMLPSKGTLQRGKKSVLMNVMADKTGPDMIACVDADYDYLLQGITPTSEIVVSNPYVFHTYVYAIENFQCYAAGLHDVCVMVTLNDRSIFRFSYGRYGLTAPAITPISPFPISAASLTRGVLTLIRRRYPSTICVTRLTGV